MDPMNMTGWIPVTVYAVIVLTFIALYSWSHADDGSGHKPFVMLVFLTIFQLVNDFISRFYVVDGFPHWVIVATTYINFLILPAIGVEWYQFVRSVLTAEERRSAGRLDIVVNLIASIGIIVLMMTPVTHWVFYFLSDSEYIRGPLFFVPAGSAFLCIIIAEVFLLTRVRSLGRRTMLTMLFFPVPPLLGAICAMFTYGLPLMPLGISISMVVLFANLQTMGMNRDYLTGLNNRRRFEELLQERMEHAKDGHRFAGIMVDVDNFKLINDTYGHAVGDIALADTARLLSRSIRKADVLARFGGDEFFIMADVNEPEELEEIVNRIREEEAQFERDADQYVLHLSKGYDFYDPEKFATVEDFEKHLDELMYANKRQHHAERGASSVKLVGAAANRRRTS